MLSNQTSSVGIFSRKNRKHHSKGFPRYEQTYRPSQIPVNVAVYFWVSYHVALLFLLVGSRGRSPSSDVLRDRSWAEPCLRNVSLNGVLASMEPCEVAQWPLVLSATGHWIIAQATAVYSEEDGGVLITQPNWGQMWAFTSLSCISWVDYKIQPIKLRNKEQRS